jgi:hypothetical protein
VSSRRFIALLVLLGIVAGAVAEIAEADLTLRLRLRGKGSVSVSHGTVPKLTDTLDGADHVLSYSIPLNVTDARGSGAGWNVSVTSTTFTDAAGATLPDRASTITAVSETCQGVGACTEPVSSSTYPLPLPAAATAPAGVVLFDAAAGTGMGAFTLTPSIDVTVPGSSYAGRYRSTVTITAAAGP